MYGLLLCFFLQAVYFTATFPYIMMIALFVRGVTLEGSEIGIRALVYPNVSKLANPEVRHLYMAFLALFNI